jgi:hypothetical protein
MRTAAFNDTTMLCDRSVYINKSTGPYSFVNQSNLVTGKLVNLVNHKVCIKLY